MANVHLENITRRYQNVTAIENISFKISDGEFWVLVGPSGCGKSTIMRTIAGLETATSGNLYIGDNLVNNIPARQRDVAMVFQNYALYPHMTVFDNMAYGLKMRGMKASQITEKVNEVAALLQITDYLTRKPNALSGGQRQRVAMGRAIVRSPAVFLFDEPLSNLDAKLRTEMRQEIKKLHQQLNTTSLYVTHDQTEAMTLASRILVLNKGQVEQIGTPKNLYQQPASLFVAGFTGHYPINFLPAKVDSASQKLITDIGIELPLSIPLKGDEDLIIAIRPEHLSVASKDQKGLLSVKVEFVEDMGADKLVQVRSPCGKTKLSIRVAAEMEIIDGQLALSPDVSKANLFDQKTGLRLGGWYD